MIRGRGRTRSVQEEEDAIFIPQKIFLSSYFKFNRPSDAEARFGANRVEKGAAARGKSTKHRVNRACPTRGPVLFSISFVLVAGPAERLGGLEEIK